MVILETSNIDVDNHGNPRVSSCAIPDLVVDCIHCAPMPNFVEGLCLSRYARSSGITVVILEPIHAPLLDWNTHRED